MNKFASSAIEATHLTKTEKISPIEASEKATIRIFGAGTPSQIKGCPKGTYLSLCEIGAVKGITKGCYTDSIKNKEYAVKDGTVLPLLII